MQEEEKVLEILIYIPIWLNSNLFEAWNRLVGYKFTFQYG